MLSDAELNEIDAKLNEADSIEAQVKRHERVKAASGVIVASTGRKVVNNGTTSILVPASPKINDGMCGFNNLGEFAVSVFKGSKRGSEVDNRLIQANATTYGNESVGADGGFAVIPDARSAIMSKVFSEDSLLARTDRMTTSSNTITMPTDMTSPWQSTGGIQASWESEGAVIDKSKISLEQTATRLHKLGAIVPVTEELLEDAPSLGTYLARKVAEKFDFKISHALAWGTGVGQPKGWMNSPALVTQAAENAQTADTINATNIVKMLSRLPTQNRTNAVWLIHPDAESQLPLMTIGNMPVYMPPGGLSAAPFGTLLGRPVIPHQICETVGDLGDIMLVDPSSYLTVTKIGGGLRSDVSMHVYFEQDIRAFKFTIRVAGMPWWSTSTTSRDGSFTQSPFVTLAAR